MAALLDQLSDQTRQENSPKKGRLGSVFLKGATSDKNFALTQEMSRNRPVSTTKMLRFFEKKFLPRIKISPLRNNYIEIEKFTLRS
jgi:hypothetical protein